MTQAPVVRRGLVVGEMTEKAIRRFWSKVAIASDDECWPWKAGRFENNYGAFALTHRKTVRAHRVAFELVNGPLKEDEIVRHECDNPPCCNPRHLIPGSTQDNVDDRKRRNRQAKGEGSGQVKLSSEQVLAIRNDPREQRTIAGDQVLHEIKLLGGYNPILSTNVPLRQDGIPYARYKEPSDQGVAVYFTLKARQMCFACDRWQTIRENMQAIAKTIEALRGIERWGSGSMVEQAFTGFVALPAPKLPHDVLGIRAGASPEEIDAAWREKSKSAHPDRGGSVEAMQELNEARRKLKGAA